MVGIAILLDLWRKTQSFNPCLYSTRTFQSAQFFSATTVVAVASIAAGSSFTSYALLGSEMAYSDAGAEAMHGDYISSTKHYDVQLKPLFSAFELRKLAMTFLRSFLMNNLPLLKPHDYFLEDINKEQIGVDLVVPFKMSVKQIIYARNVPQSAARKAARKMPILVYIYRVSQTTFKGHMLGVAASWIVQVGIDLYGFFTWVLLTGEEEEEDDDDDKINVNRSNQVGLLGAKVFVATVWCISSLIFVPIGAGIGAALIRPLLKHYK